MVASQVGIDLSLYKATGTISIENVELFFNLINNEIDISDTYVYFFECLSKQSLKKFPISTGSHNKACRRV